MLRICSAFVFLIVASTASADVSGRLQFIDADTVRIGAATVRLHGIDAPEASQTCTRKDGREFACGTWATRWARRAFGGKRAECRVLDTDRYGRLVAKCYVGNTDIGAELVRNGIALAYLRYATDYAAIEKQASIQRIGLWSGALVAPWEYRAQGFGAATARKAAASGGNCAIKGNISSGGKIYHLPGQKYYAATRIDPRRGERWFCSEAQARAAGWRKARR